MNTFQAQCNHLPEVVQDGIFADEINSVCSRFDEGGLLNTTIYEGREVGEVGAVERGGSRADDVYEGKKGEQETTGHPNDWDVSVGW